MTKNTTSYCFMYFYVLQYKLEGKKVDSPLPTPDLTTVRQIGEIMKQQYDTERIPLLNPAQRIIYFVYAVCLIVAGLDIWFWRA
jgi:hypothetical protein